MQLPHPCVIVQADLLEHELHPRTIIVPFTSTKPKRVLPYVVPVDPPEGGLRRRSYALCDQITRIDKARIMKRGGGPLSAETMTRIDDALRVSLNL